MLIFKLLQLVKNNVGQFRFIWVEIEGREVMIYLYGVIGGWWGDIDEMMFV